MLTVAILGYVFDLVVSIRDIVCKALFRSARCMILVQMFSIERATEVCRRRLEARKLDAYAFAGAPPNIQ